MTDIPKAADLWSKASAIIADRAARERAEAHTFAATIITTMAERAAHAAEGDTYTTYRFTEPRVYFTDEQNRLAQQLVREAFVPAGYSVIASRGSSRGGPSTLEVTLNWENAK